MVEASIQTGDAVKDLAERVTLEIDQMPSNLSALIENKLRSLLEEYLKKDTEMQRDVRSGEDAADTEPEQVTHDELSPLSQHRPAMPRSAKLKKSNGAGTSHLYKTWLGKVHLRTTNTLYLNSRYEGSEPHLELTLTRRIRSDMLIMPKPWLRKRGTLIRHEQQHKIWVESPSSIITIQHFNTVSENSPIFKIDSVQEARVLFSTGAASIFDRDENGLTLLDVAFSKAFPLLARYQDLCSNTEADLKIQGLLELIKFYAELGLDPAGMECELPEFDYKSPLKKLLELDDGATKKWPKRNAYISQLARLIIEHSEIDPLDDLDLNDIHHGGYWRDSEFPATRAILSQNSWHIDWNYLAEQTASYSLPASTPSIGTKLANLFTSPCDRTTTRLRYFGVHDDDWEHVSAVQCHILGLLLAAGMPASSVHDHRGAFDETPVNDGSLLHVAISDACPETGHSWSIEEYLRVKLKLRDVLATCLKHGVDPESHNLGGMSVTSFAKKKELLSVWKDALRMAGRDAEDIVAQSKDIETGWKPGTEVLI